MRLEEPATTRDINLFGVDELPTSYPDTIELPPDPTDHRKKRFGEYSEDGESEEEEEWGEQKHRRRQKRGDSGRPATYRLLLPDHWRREIPSVVFLEQPDNTLSNTNRIFVEEIPEYNPYAIVPYAPPPEILFLGRDANGNHNDDDHTKSRLIGCLSDAMEGSTFSHAMDEMDGDGTGTGTSTDMGGTEQGVNNTGVLDAAYPSIVDYPILEGDAMEEE